MEDKLRWYEFKDMHGHDLHKCQDYIDLLEAVRMGQWHPADEAPNDVEVWVCNIDRPGSTEKAERRGDKWYTADINAIELFPTHYHDLIPDQPNGIGKAGAEV